MHPSPFASGCLNPRARGLRPAVAIVILLAAAIAMYPGRSLAGAAGCGIFVAATGVDNATCGLSPTSPCRTIHHGIARAATVGHTCVFVQAGDYAEALSLASGVNVDGGYDVNWERGPYTDPAHRVRVIGNNSPGKFLAVSAINLGSPTRLSNLVLVGPNASGTNGSRQGHSSYVVYAVNSALILRDVDIRAGNGANGSAGPEGADILDNAPSGAPGEHANAFAEPCDITTHGAGGEGATNAGCSIGINPAGGRGGDGGEMHTSCGPSGLCSNCNPTAGDPGQAAAYSPGAFGDGGPLAGPCQPGEPGQNGAVTNGAAGLAGSTDGVISGGDWFASSGGDGGLGENGGGGGGGGGSGGCNVIVTSVGAGGGGGGAGGCRAPTIAQGGGGGGGSFGIFLLTSSVTLDNVQVTRGNGGSGGAGGAGGRGQDGGEGGPGGTGVAGTQDAGAGGRGGHGGHGGGAAGGNGGISAAIYSCPGSVVSGSVSATGGAGGSGDAGGISAPGAPPAVDDGNDGPPGLAGSVFAAVVGAAADCPSGAAPTGAEPAACVIDPCVVDAPAASLPKSIEFYGAQPNPTRGTTTFRIALPAAAQLKLELFDQTGRRVVRLCDERYAAGLQSISWSGALDSGRLASPGVYLVRATVAHQVMTRTVIVLK